MRWHGCWGAPSRAGGLRDEEGSAGGKVFIDWSQTTSKDDGLGVLAAGAREAYGFDAGDLGGIGGGSKKNKIDKLVF